MITSRSKIAPWVFLAFSLLYYRNARLYKQFFAPPTLPTAFSEWGNVNTTCAVIRDAGGDRLRYCEDVVRWDFALHDGTKDSRVLFSCDPGRKNWNTVMGPLRDPSPRGDIWFHDPHDPNSSPSRIILLGLPTTSDFHPLGIHAVQNGPGMESHLFIVNHQRHNTTIEFFILPLPHSGTRPILARHVQTLSHPSFVSPNAIATISPSSFYVTNDHLMTRRLPSIFGEILPMVETSLALPLGWVDRVDLDLSNTAPGQVKFAVSRAISNIPFANGIAISADKQELAVASSTTLNVYLYEVNTTLTENRIPRHKGSIQVPFHPDNLSYGAGRTLYVGGHPAFFSLIKVSKRKQLSAPSWVASFTPSKDDMRSPAMSSGVRPTHTMQTLYQSDGSGFGMSTTGAFVSSHVDGTKDAIDGKGSIFVTGLYEEGVLECKR